MKIALITLFQFLVFFAAFAGGIVVGVFSPLHLQWFLTVTTPGHTRYFDPTGLLLTLLVYVVILLIEAARKTIRLSAPRTTIALLLAILAGFVLKFGFVG